MNFIDKSNSSMGAINPRYDLSYKKWKELAEGAEGIADAVSLGFGYGYFQGMKAAEAECRKKPAENPKKVKELRQAIIYTVNKTRSTFALNDVYMIADLLQRKMDYKEYTTLTSAEWSKATIINHILQSESEENIRHADSFIRGLELADRKRKECQA
ncbi:hypothetical protein MCI89_04605 [Muricomes sp. OA1]|uniref:hypothetical protein n=1 Tax=Muricomes sp. OA1 TaxID=2914165 RepID=UPI001F05AF10|nr:hypothetical protein [Muricomes sp. OA1]MCH1971628.1 hypothetical protein [Muricomes sp. OA1]